MLKCPVQVWTEAVVISKQSRAYFLHLSAQKTVEMWRLFQAREAKLRRSVASHKQLSEDGANTSDNTSKQVSWVAQKPAPKVTTQWGKKSAERTADYVSVFEYEV